MAIEKIVFDFEEWAALARLDPLAFEERRQEIVQRVVGKATHVRRMAGLQWRIDQERIRARTPLKATLRISSMMWESFYVFAECLNRIVGYESSCLDSTPAKALPAQLRLLPGIASSRHTTSSTDPGNASA